VSADRPKFDQGSVIILDDAHWTEIDVRECPSKHSSFFQQCRDARFAGPGDLLKDKVRGKGIANAIRILAIEGFDEAIARRLFHTFFFCTHANGAP
jgi:hypothetical protein